MEASDDGQVLSYHGIVKKTIQIEEIVIYRGYVVMMKIMICLLELDVIDHTAGVLLENCIIEIRCACLKRIVHYYLIKNVRFYI